ncbi:hypothetical protein BaRGS_00021371 [Batillaria attramentaria]|uniref:tetrahydrofolate synthase n=1 Tax=Batillaria attramentaria TaxID=370345 RepID=A0ABD0KJR7_9CAEN
MLHKLTSPTAARSFSQDAIAQLNSLQSNAETIRKSAECRRDPAQHIPQMRDYLTRVGLSMAEIDRLSVIHVAGTKGKGCTCAFVESILRRCPEVGKVGFYSSPHLLGVCERIRINGQPIHEDMFSKYFWDVYDKLKRTQDDYCGDMPFYFSFLTVMSLYVFVREAVNVAILEVGIGGEYDSTNVVQRPVVCGVTSLDLDHTNLLGNTLDKIAWQKAGIFKSGVPAITVPQSTDSVRDVMLKRAKEKGCPLYVAQPLASTGLPGGLPLGIAGDRQRYNAALAVQLCQVWLQTRADSLSSCRWHGRYQTICRPGVTYYLDGAHTPDSIEACEQWFQKAAERESGQLSHTRSVIRAMSCHTTTSQQFSKNSLCFPSSVVV